MASPHFHPAISAHTHEVRGTLLEHEPGPLLSPEDAPQPLGQ